MRTNEQFEADFAHHTEGLEFISVGACPGCRECGLESEWVVWGPEGKVAERCGDDEEAAREAANEWNRENGSGYAVFLSEPSPEQVAAANEGDFSWHACDFCGSTLGGYRYPAHAVLRGETTHFRVCADCLCYVANGDLPNE